MSDINININPNPAQTTIVDTADNFTDFVNKVTERSQRELKFDNGNPIILEPDSEYATLLLKVSKIATPAQFSALLPYLMGGIVEATRAGAIPLGWLEDITTAFNIVTPPVPKEYIDNEHTIKMILMGNTYLLTIRKQK